MGIQKNLNLSLFCLHLFSFSEYNYGYIHYGYMVEFLYLKETHEEIFRCKRTYLQLGLVVQKTDVADADNRVN